MTYEIVTTDNGELVRSFTDRNEASAAFVDYVDRHLPTHPGLEHRVMLIALEDDRTRSAVWTYQDLREHFHTVHS